MNILHSPPPSTASGSGDPLARRGEESLPAPPSVGTACLPVGRDGGE